MRTKHFALFVAVASLIAGIVVSPAVADPLPGQILKFQQVPQNGPQFFGHDELSTANAVRNPTGAIIGYTGTYMADDFADKFSTPVVHVRWWGSYINNSGLARADKFLISFETDVPQGPNNPFSHPGIPLLNQIVTEVPAGGGLFPGSGTFTERPIGGLPTETLFEYNAELNLGKEFPQKIDTVYWLKIVALVDEQPNTVDPIRWGWHNRDYTVPNPLASTAPAVIPGETLVGTVPGPTGGAVPVFHFQDDSVSGTVNVFLNPDMPRMPFVEQLNDWAPQRYVAPSDGPAPIIEFSKDLAFELYTVPEPGTLSLCGVAAICALLVARRRKK